MIISKLIGGNGNQMFQYSVGFALAKKHNLRLLLDINYLLDNSKRYFRHEQRDYALNMFNISASIATSKEISRFIVPRVGNKYLYHLRKRIIPKYNVFNEKQILCPDDLLKLPSEAYIEGYWQNVQYIDAISSDIRNEFSFKNKIPDQCHQILKKIKNTTSVCIIFRRGDFVNHPILDIVKLDYYYAAIKILLDKLPDSNIFVFSDDIDWCKVNFKPEGSNYEFVDQDLTGPNAEYYFQLITSCNHFIIPNSTFAWWGAWLSGYPNKVVIAPGKWHKNQIEKRNAILPAEWIAM